MLAKDFMGSNSEAGLLNDHAVSMVATNLLWRIAAFVQFVSTDIDSHTALSEIPFRIKCYILREYLFQSPFLHVF